MSSIFSSGKKAESSRPKHNKVVNKALAMYPKNDRIPAIDLRTIEDVSTAACVELSRSIMRRPEINTGMLFSAIAASKHRTNRSDSVIVITAAILETIGNKKAAESILNKSGSVMSLYRNMNLDQDNLRDSFVILLFALAPEFVKMVESSLTIALNRVKEMTSASGSGPKLSTATGELLRSNVISGPEYISMTSDVNRLSIEMSGDSASPTDMIDASDSVSNVGKIVHSDSPVDTAGLMAFIKNTPRQRRSSFASAFPSAKRPVEAVKTYNRHGIGFANESRLDAGTASESGMTAAINSLLPKTLAHKRHSITDADREAARVMSREQATDDNKSLTKKAEFGTIPDNWMDAVVTTDDIKDSSTVMANEMGARSRLSKRTLTKEERERLMSLL